MNYERNRAFCGLDDNCDLGVFTVSKPVTEFPVPASKPVTVPVQSTDTAAPPVALEIWEHMERAFQEILQDKPHTPEQEP